MSIRTTVTLDDDVVARLKEESRARSIPFRELLNTAVRSGLAAMQAKAAAAPFVIEPISMGWNPGLNYDDIASLIEYGEGPNWR